VKRSTPHGHNPARELSVSSYGSCGVKPTTSKFSARFVLPFSILLRIVRGETYIPFLTQPSFDYLSVSSYGSCGVKLFITFFVFFPRPSFSILLRIVRGETSQSKFLVVASWSFQYPLTDRAG